MDNQMTLPDATPIPISEDFVFEGPEKKLEVYFSRCTGVAEGLRQVSRRELVEVLNMAKCSILHQQSNADFDAYLLSESSCFIFSDRIILKTCGTTTLLLVLPKLIPIAEKLGMRMELLQYGHFRYKFPEQQVYPHSSFNEEAAYLSDFMAGQPASTGDTYFGEVTREVLGSHEGCCWYMLVVERLSQPDSSPPPPSSPREGDDIFEVAMEGLSKEVRQCFGIDSAGPYDRAAAQQMTLMSGLTDILPGVTIDSWAFEPCGYSMNGLRNGFYYTVHVTPEPAFSFASFETNDARYCQPHMLERIVSIFEPTMAVVSLTNRRDRPELPAYILPGFKRLSMESKPLGNSASAVCVKFAKVHK